MFNCFPASRVASPRHGLGFAALLALLVLPGCGGQREDLVFNVKFVRFLADGRPVVEVTSNGRPLPKGTGPYGDYILVLRPDDTTPYTRQFEFKAGETKAVERDFMIPRAEYTKFSRITVSVVNPEKGSVDAGVRLSEVVTLPAQ